MLMVSAPSSYHDTVPFRHIETTIFGPASMFLSTIGLFVGLVCHCMTKETYFRRKSRLQFLSASFYVPERYCTKARVGEDYHKTSHVARQACRLDRLTTFGPMGYTSRANLTYKMNEVLSSIPSPTSVQKRSSSFTRANQLKPTVRRLRLIIRAPLPLVSCTLTLTGRGMASKNGSTVPLYCQSCPSFPA